MYELTDLIIFIVLIPMELGLIYLAHRKWMKKPPTKADIDKPLINPKAIDEEVRKHIEGN